MRGEERAAVPLVQIRSATVFANVTHAYLTDLSSFKRFLLAGRSRITFEALTFESLRVLFLN